MAGYYLDGLVVNEMMLELYFRFLCERQTLYNKKVSGLPPPWTLDPILQKYKINNVYRELDRGTVWYIEHVASADLENLDIIFQTIIYRLINNYKTFDRFGLPPLGSILPWFRKLEKYYREGNVIFNSAYMLFAGTPKGGEKIEELKKTLFKLSEIIFDIVANIKAATLPSQVIEAISYTPHVADFIAYEVYSDLLYCDNLLPFNENSFVNVGGGAEPALDWIFISRMSAKIPYANCVEILRRHQDTLFDSFNLDFPFYKDRKLSLRNIEHSLCEFRKYTHRQQGVGRVRLYTP